VTIDATFTLTRAEHGRAFDDLHPLLWWQLVPWITQPGGKAHLRARIWMGGLLLVVVGVPLLFAQDDDDESRPGLIATYEITNGDGRSIVPNLHLLRTGLWSVC
jgi:hypothetical protein